MANVNPFQNPSPYPTTNWSAFGPPDTRGLPQGVPLSPEQFGPNGSFTPQGMPQGWSDTRALPQGGPPPFVPQAGSDTRGLIDSFLNYINHHHQTRGLPQGAPPSSGAPGNEPDAPPQGAGGTSPGGPLPPVDASPAGAQGAPTGAQGAPTGAQDPSAAGPLSPEEKAALQSVLAIIKENRNAIANNRFTMIGGYRILAACAYLSGFLEAKGMGEVGAFVNSIPPAKAPEKAGGAGSEQDQDELIQGVEALIAGGPPTRGLGGKVLKFGKKHWETALDIGLMAAEII